jgi:rod shape determining protein RodA
MNIDIERSQRIDYVKKFDYILMGIVFLITAIGLVFLKSAMNNAYKDHGASAMKIQIIGLIVGIMFAMVICFFDYGNLRNISFPFFLFNMGMMMLVFVPRIGIASGGSRSWINIGITTYQPSELMKLAMIIVLAKYLEKIQEDKLRPEYVAVLLLAFFVPLGMVLLQKDFGMALVFIFVFFVMMIVGKMKFKFIAVLGVLACAAMPFIWKFYFNGVKRERFLAFLNPELYEDSYGLQLVRAITAIGSGGLTGDGIGSGDMNTANRIPVKLSDMIFAVIGEETGFIGAMLVVTLFTAMLLRMLYISYQSRDIFGACLAAGVFAMFFFNVFENLGMNVGIMPITGLPLPFVSKGGSAMITNYISVGLLLSISLRRRKGMFL